jgi:preprotein translocase subunit SecG
MILIKILWALHIIVALLLIVVVLLQTGKGSEAGFAFGSGAAQTMFGASGGKTFINRFTVILAISFMVISFTLAYFQSKVSSGYKGVLEKAKAVEQNQPPVKADTGKTEPIPADK